jgi:hypothetical protein
VHLASLGLLGVTIVLLMAPAAFHRIVEGGEDTERLHQVSTMMVLGPLVPLRLGLAGDFCVVANEILGAQAAAIVLAAASPPRDLLRRVVRAHACDSRALSPRSRSA